MTDKPARSKKPQKAMTLAHAEPVPEQLSDDQRARFLEAIANDKLIGIVPALRQAGVPGTKGELRQLVANDEQLQDEVRLARGWNLNRVEGVAWEVALNSEHPSWDRANARILKAYHPAFRDRATVEHTGEGGGPVEVTSDVSAAIDRFTALTAAAIRAAGRDTEGTAPQLSE